MTTLRGAAGAQAGWAPQPQPLPGLAVAKPRADGEAEQGLRLCWCRVSGERAAMVVLPAP